jgi:hypothetical protein
MILKPLPREEGRYAAHDDRKYESGDGVHSHVSSPSTTIDRANST